MGTTMEFYLNDSNDIPDFDLGENLVNNDMTGSILRFMENPSQDGNSIENVCDFQSDMPVHYTSGVLNKAFTSAARSCEANSCSGDLRECLAVGTALHVCKYSQAYIVEWIHGFCFSNMWSN